MYIAIQLVMDLGHPGRGASDPLMHGLLHGAHAIINQVLQLRHTSKLQSVPQYDATHASTVFAFAHTATAARQQTVTSDERTCQANTSKHRYRVRAETLQSSQDVHQKQAAHANYGQSQTHACTPDSQQTKLDRCKPETLAMIKLCLLTVRCASRQGYM